MAGDEQARILRDAVSAVEPPATVVEIGSYARCLVALVEQAGIETAERPGSSGTVARGRARRTTTASRPIPDNRRSAGIDS